MKAIQKFMLLGATTTLIDYLVFSVAVTSGLHYVPAIILGYGTGLWANFILGRRYIFTGGVKVSTARAEFTAVVLIALGGVVINIAVVKALSDSWLHLDPLLSRIVAIGAAFFWNYFMRKRYVYH